MSRGYSALFSGVVFVAVGVGYFAALLAAGRLAARLGHQVLALGAVLVPLASTVLAGVDPQHAGAAAGVLSTAQQAGGALGVAVIGMVFFGSGAVVHAFVVSLWVLAALTVATAVLAQLLRPTRSQDCR